MHTLTNTRGGRVPDSQLHVHAQLRRTCEKCPEVACQCQSLQRKEQRFRDLSDAKQTGENPRNVHATLEETRGGEAA